MTKRKKIKLIGMTLCFIGILSASILAPYIFKEINEVSISERLQPPSWEHVFGTDDFGRDLLVRIIYGLRTSIFIAIVIEILSLLTGIVIGLTVGYFGGWIDDLFTLLMNVLMGFPNMILALGFFSIFGQGILVMILIITLTHWITYARLIRSMAIGLKESDFVKSAICAGASKNYILRHHILINVIVPIIPMSTLMIGHMIMVISGLAFLGFGVQPPLPEIGIMLKESIVYIREAPWMVFFPGMVLFLCSLFFSIFGETMRDVLDPQASIDINQM